MENLKVYGFEMARISEVYLSTLSTIMKPYGLERYFMPLLHLCENSGKVTQQELATALRVDKVTAMRMVDYLSERGLLVRKQNSSDKRCRILEVTSKAKLLAHKIEEAVHETNELLLDGFSKAEKKDFKLFMDKLFKTISGLPEPKYIVKAVRRNNK